MKETYVSYKVAKFLKEKGFTISSNTSYEDYIWQMYDEHGKVHWGVYSNDWYFRITQQMACDWLTEEKNIYVTAVPDIGNSLRFYPAIYVIKGEIPEEYWFEHINSVVKELNKSYDKPQQAIEAALEYVLTKLI